MVIRSFRVAMVAFATLAVSVPWTAFAIDYTWSVLGGGTQSWTAPANWNPNTGAPTTADDAANLGVALSGNLTVDVGASDVTVGRIVFGGTAGAVTTDVSSSGGNLILNSSSTNASITSAGTVGSINRITAPLILGDAAELAADSTANFTIAGNLGMTGAARSLTNLMVGGPTLTIGSGSGSTIQLFDVASPATGYQLQLNVFRDVSGTSSLTTVINARWNNTGATGASLVLGGNGNANPGATYVMLQSQTSTAGVTINRQGYVLAADNALGLGQVTMANNNVQIWGAELRSDNDARVLNNTRLQMGNPIAVTGSNSLTLNSTIGQTNNNRAFGNALPAGKQLTLAGGTASPAIAITTASDLVGRTFTIDGPGTTIVSGSVVNALDPAADPFTTSNFIKRGTGRLELNNPLNTIRGTITAGGGLLVFGTNGSFGTTSGITVLPAGGVSYAPGTADAGFTAFAAKLTGSSAGYLALPLSNASSNLDFSGTSALAAAPGLSVVGDGNMTYTGVVTPGTAGYNWGGLSGTLTLGANASVGANAVTYKNGGTVVLTGSQSYSGVTTIQDATMLTAQGGITTRSGNSFTGTSAIVYASTLSVSQVSNAGANSTLGSSGAAAANLVIDGGVLRHTGGSNSSTDRLFTIGSRGATLESTGAGAVTIGSAGGANLHSGTGARTLTLGGASGGRNTVGSQLTNGTDVVNDVLSLTKAGTGTWVLSANNTYTGSTSVTAGSLFINGNQALATGSVSVATGATLGGSGTVGGLVTLSSNATLSPGSSVGTLTLGQSLSLVGGGNYNWQMLSATGTAGAANAWDLLSVTGSLSIDSTSVDPFKINLWTLSGTSPDTNGNAANFNSASNYTWKIATAAGGISGFDATKFQIVASATNGTGGFSNTYGSGTFSIAQSGNDLNLVFTAGAPPSVITINVASGTQTQTAAGYPLLSGSVPVQKIGAGTLVVDQANTLTGSTTVQGGRLQLANSSALGSSRLVPLAGGTVTLTSALQTTVGGLAPSAGGLTDVGNGMVTVAAGLSAPDMVAAIITGLGDGSWNGTSGITSSVAAASGGDRTVGWLDNGDGTVTFAFAAAGDTNLDWQVDIIDAANFLAGGKFDSGSPASWNEGDFTYDGVVDILDAASFLSNGLFDAGPYNGSGQAGGIAAVPEPTTWALLATATGLTLTSLRRRKR